MKLKASPVSLFYVNLIIRPAKEPRREGGKSVLPLALEGRNMLETRPSWAADVNAD